MRIGVAQVYMAEVLREWNDLGPAEELVRQGIARCREWAGLAETALDGYITLARLLQYRGDMRGAFVVLDEAETIGRDCHVSQFAERIELARLRLWLATGDDAALRGWVRTRQGAWQADGEPGYVGLLQRIMLARLHLTRGKPDDALALLSRLEERAEAGGLVGCTIEILSLRALALHGQGQTAQAVMHLARPPRVQDRAESYGAPGRQ